VPLIVVDKNVRAKWQAAWKKSGGHETRCEQLGAVHLLSHGIWAFKTSANGATDLVYSDPIDRYSTIVRQTARALGFNLRYGLICQISSRMSGLGGAAD
jgi:hypothetical protein